MASAPTPSFLPVPIKLLTFDLDDTIWSTSPTITAANVACQSFVDSELGDSSKPIWEIMKSLFKSSPTDYYKVRDDDETSGLKREPVYLTKLRSDAITKLHASSLTSSPPSSSSSSSSPSPSPPPPESVEFASKAFKVWTDTRHTSIESHLASDVVETLTRLRQKYPDLLIGGITNGNGSPLSVKSLSGLFDFNISAEDVGYGKPFQDIYLQAHTIAMSLNPNVPSEIGPWWVHVGDDMIKDIVASKGLEIRTIYTTEFKENDGRDEAVGVHVTESSKPNSRTTSKPETESDYLMQKIQSDFVDAHIASFNELPDVFETLGGGGASP
ncbi:hypothetical protein TrVE_jg11815 [Triparma verrucosa]|uniref:Uncharacterized protein n=1 Tax=Triparma verrucosa TaxID=1606542 RepID=A0A9W7ELI9_9STRA|nr:hypothetical protein TrVE_jg11815 [Triparma verrucosa]